MTIKLVTFKTNHTVLAKVLDEGDVGVIIKEPVQVVSIPPSASNPEGGIAFSPFLEYSEEFKTGIVIKNSDILTINHPIVDLENQYNRIFGSGIQIASTIS